MKHKWKLNSPITGSLVSTGSAAFRSGRDWIIVCRIYGESVNIPYDAFDTE